MDFYIIHAKLPIVYSIEMTLQLSAFDSRRALAQFKRSSCFPVDGITDRETALLPESDSRRVDGDVRLSHGQNLSARRGAGSWRERSSPTSGRRPRLTEAEPRPAKESTSATSKGYMSQGCGTIVERLCTLPIGKSYTRSSRIVQRQTCSYTALKILKILIRWLTEL